MNAAARPQRSVGITLRTALLSWLVTIITLGTFITVVIPQQQRTFLENLESKARGTVVSLREVAASAVVNEDLGSVVEHCQEMLKGDEVLDYIVITKQDGFSLISERSGWRFEPYTSPEWRPTPSGTANGIGFVPLFQRRVFRYSQPFEHSNLPWGWIHVGLSLDGYDRSLEAAYQRTGWLALFCIGLSFLASVVYAKRIVRPILQLREMVEKVAQGDLSARAEVERADELGSLASSINSMSRSLLQRDRMLQSVRFAAQQFLSTTNWSTVIGSVLSEIGRAAQIHQAFVFHVRTSPEGEAQSSRRQAWVALASEDPPRLPPARDPPQLKQLPSAWEEQLRRREIVAEVRSDGPAAAIESPASLDIRALILVPVFVEGAWWGFLGLEHDSRERVWTDAERASLRAVSDMLGAAIASRCAQDAVVEAKENLEFRVRQRTRELQEQVRAREEAHTQLEATQHRLMDLSRQAGMAEVATGVLHNVGNVLNSVNVSINLLQERTAKSKLTTLEKTADLLRENRSDLLRYLAEDAKGRLIPDFLIELSRHLTEERVQTLEEMKSLASNLEHVKEIVATQQSYARIAGVLDALSPVQLVEDALRINEAGLRRHQIEVERCLSLPEVPPVLVDKHKVLQILINLIRNAKYALDEIPADRRRLRLALELPCPGCVRIVVADNGVGIAPENLTRIFSHGFTTRRDGHGFGLHSGALAAKEMKGSLIAESPGLGLGATFTLELPIATPRVTPSCNPSL